MSLNIQPGMSKIYNSKALTRQDNVIRINVNRCSRIYVFVHRYEKTYDQIRLQSRKVPPGLNWMKPKFSSRFAVSSENALTQKVNVSLASCRI